MLPKITEVGLWRWLYWLIFSPPKCKSTVGLKGGLTGDIGWGNVGCLKMSELRCRGGYCFWHCTYLCSDACSLAFARKMDKAKV